MRHLLLVLAPVLVVAGLSCQATPERPLEVDTLQQEIGEPQGGFPIYPERALLYLTNRVRLDASRATDVGCPRNFTGIGAKPPLDYNLTLSWSSRFHSKTFVKAPCFQHASCCFVQGTGLSAYCCDQAGGAGCSTAAEKYTCANCGGGQSCTGTSFADRIAKTFQYSGQAFGENIAVGYPTTKDAFCAFFDEGPDANDGIEHGHFLNIMSEPDRAGKSTPSWNEMGGGFYSSTGCSSGGGTLPGLGYTQDFGLRSGITRSKIPSALHRPESGSSVVIGAIWNAAAAPKLISAVVDGVCTPLTLKAGSPAVGAYEAAVPLSAGCHRYYVFAQEAAGNLVTYPDTGSLQVGSTATACSADYVATRLSASCCNAQVLCPNSGSCNGGSCGSICTPGQACTASGGCQTGSTTCPGGTSTCSSLTNTANGTACGPDQVCNAGQCVGCVAGTVCPDPAAPTNSCRSGTTSCATGTSTCANVGNAANGSACGAAGQSCFNGACISCSPGAPCTDPANPCRQGTTSCSTGAPVCQNLTTAVNGTACGGGNMCFGGSCVACTPGAPCVDPTNSCKEGTIDCSTGVSTCAGLTNVPDGSACGAGLSCYNGACSSCPGGDKCTDPADPCRGGTVSCSTGQPVCRGIGPLPDGVACGSGQVCKSGACLGCSAGAPCFGANPCSRGSIDCSTGTAKCTNFQTQPNGTTCGTGMSCFNGSCLACDAGAPCAGAGSCQSGKVDCSSGTAVCTNIGSSPNGTACTGGVCNSGSCVGCNQGASCSDGNVCHSATLDCATGTAVCSNVQDKPNGTSCGSSQVCLNGACNTCQAGFSCFGPDNCSTGTISCASGSPVCGSLTPRPVGTVCGSGKVCTSTQSCVACSEGQVCVANGGCQVGSTDCSTGVQSCKITTTKANGRSCGTDRVCRAGQCVICADGATCSPNNNPCQSGIIDCASGSPVCSNVVANSNGSSCGSDKVCSNGSCVACTDNLACLNPGNPCQQGKTSCATGSSLCQGFANLPSGSSCGTDKVCNAGTCTPCVSGAACTDPANACRNGTLSCGTGTPICGGYANTSDGTACATGKVCSSGACIACDPTVSCTDPANGCRAGKISCAGGVASCDNFVTLPDGASCGTRQVCRAGVCNLCGQGDACVDPANPCRIGKVSCTSGAPLCTGLSDAANGTSCGVDQVCSGAVCTACAAGAPCTPPGSPCQKGGLDCSTGRPVCARGVSLPDGAGCGLNGETCSGGACVLPVADAGRDAASPGDAAAPADAAGLLDSGASTTDAGDPIDAGTSVDGGADVDATREADGGEATPPVAPPAGCGCRSTEGVLPLVSLLGLVLRRRR